MAERKKEHDHIEVDGVKVKVLKYEGDDIGVIL